MEKKEILETVLPLSVKDLISAIPDALLEKLCEDYEINWNSKKLHGEEFFKLCLFGILNDNHLSTRILSSYYQNKLFRNYANIDADKKVSHSSIAERLEKIDVRYFESIFNWLSMTYRDKIEKAGKIRVSRYDATTTSLSSKLLKYGMVNGQKKKNASQHSTKSIKFSVGFDGLPFNVFFQRAQSEVNDSVALGDILKTHSVNEKDVAVFDRGVQDRKVFAGMSAGDQSFVTRAKENTAYQLVKGHSAQILNQKTATLHLRTEEIVYLYTANKQLVETPFRLIKGVNLATNEPIFFLSNLPKEEFTAEEITEIYKKRWDIECFFRFLKQELNFKHYFSHSWNGIQVMTYMILIAAILLLVYKHTNQLKGYKLVKKRFVNELQDLILQDIIIRCGGNPELLEKMNQT